MKTLFYSVGLIIGLLAPVSNLQAQNTVPPVSSSLADPAKTSNKPAVAAQAPAIVIPDADKPVASPGNNGAGSPPTATVTSGSRSEGSIVLEKTLKCPIDTVWQRWTTSAGVAAFFAPQSKIELAPGGKYEFWIAPAAPEGQRGTEGCRVLSFIPKRMFSFEWSIPPSITALRNSGARTQVVLELEPAADGGTRLRLTNLGYGSGADWDAAYSYLAKAWPNVLNALNTSCK